MVEYSEVIYDFLWTPWVRFLSILGGPQTAAMAVPATIAMAVVGSFLYLFIRYMVVARVAGAMDVPETTQRRVAIITTVGIVLLMGYTGAILFIAPLFTGLVTFIGIAFIFVAFFMVWAISKKGWAMAKTEAREAKEMSEEAEDLMGEEKQEDVLAGTEMDLEQLEEKMEEMDLKLEQQMYSYHASLLRALSNARSAVKAYPKQKTQITSPYVPVVNWLIAKADLLLKREQKEKKIEKKAQKTSRKKRKVTKAEEKTTKKIGRTIKKRKVASKKGRRGR